MDHRHAADAKTMKRELELQRKQIAYEVEQREHMMRVLNQEKSIPAVPQEHLLALDRRNDEEDRLREEVNEMKRFLAKGVSEAKRLAILADTLKTTHRELSQAQEALEDDQVRLNETKRSLEIEIETTKGAALQQAEAKSDLELNVHSLAAGAQETIRDVELSRAEAKHQNTQIEQLNVLMRRLERVDQGADNLAAATRRAHHQIEKLHRNVTTGSTNASSSRTAAPPVDDSETERSDYDSEEDAEPSANAEVICNSAKVTVSKCESLLSMLHSTLSRFESDEKQRLIASRYQRVELLDQMKAELSDLKARSDHHLQTMKQELLHREPLLARYTDVRAEAMERNARRVMDENFDGTVSLEKDFNLLAFLDVENRALEAEQKVLAEKNQKLSDKVEKRSVDYEAVRQLRHTYRDLETKKTLLSIDLRGAEEENKTLKSTLWLSGNTPLSVQELKPAATKHRNKPAWKSTVQM